MNELSKKIKETLTILNKEDVLKDIIIIGSWCTYFYDKLFEGYTNTLMTTDIDFFVPNAKKIKERESIIKAFKTINYE